MPETFKPSPPNSRGICGAQSPAAFTLPRRRSSSGKAMFSCLSKLAGSDSSGRISSATKSRMRRSRAAISGEGVKSITGFLKRKAAVDDQHAARHIRAGIGGEQQQRAFEIREIADPTLGNAADELGALRARQKIFGHLAVKITRTDGIDADPVVGQFQSHRSGQMDQSGLGGGIPGYSRDGLQSQNRGDIDDASAMAQANHV